MSSKRIQQISSDIRDHIATLLATGRIADPRIRNVTVQSVKVSPDVSIARIYYTVLGTEEDRKAAGIGLASAAGFLRRSLSETLRLRHTPHVVFQFDETTEKAYRIHELLASVKQEPPLEDPAEEEKS